MKTGGNQTMISINLRNQRLDHKRMRSKNFLSLTFLGCCCTFVARGGEIAFKFLYHFRTTPCNNNQKRETMNINTLQK